MPRKNKKQKPTWIQTISGKKIDLLKPNIDDIDIQDIATSLSNISRFTGHTIKHSPVSAHSILVSLLAAENGESRAVQFAGLLHDSPEFALGDINSPLKTLLPDYRKIEERWTKAIALKYNVELEDFKRIKPYDHEAVIIEANSVFKVKRPEWDTENLHAYSLPYRKFYNVEWNPEHSRELFLIMFTAFQVGKK